MRRVRNLCQDEHDDVFRYTTEKLHNIANLYITSNKAATICPTQGSREVTTSSGKEASFDLAIQFAKDGAKGDRKRCKQHHQGATTTIDHDDGSYGKAGGSGTGHVMTAAHGDRHQVRPPTNHFRRLLEEACPNHFYPVRRKLKDCDMMKSFMSSGSFT
jgi:hypothetical protein